MFAGFVDSFSALFNGQVENAAWALAEILILTYLLYQVLLVLRGTRAAPVVMGIAVLALLYYLSVTLGLTTIRWLFDVITPYVIITLIVIFQTEIRRTLRHLALYLAPSGRSSNIVRFQYEDVIFAVSHLSREKTGALIVLEREAGLRTFIQSGVALDARLSSDLLVSIFQRGAPLHDGAVIIQRDIVAAAACFLPLTTNPELMSSLGTRHRAAIGITEESDCLTIVVSETAGTVSIASAGNIELGVSLDRLRLRLIEHFGPVVPPPRGKEVALAEMEKTEPVVTQLEGSSSPRGSEN